MQLFWAKNTARGVHPITFLKIFPFWNVAVLPHQLCVLQYHRPGLIYPESEDCKLRHAAWSKIQCSGNSVESNEWSRFPLVATLLVFIFRLAAFRFPFLRSAWGWAAHSAKAAFNCFYLKWIPLRGNPFPIPQFNIICCQDFTTKRDIWLSFVTRIPFRER